MKSFIKKLASRKKEKQGNAGATVQEAIAGSSADPPDNKVDDDDGDGGDDGDNGDTDVDSDSDTDSDVQYTDSSSDADVTRPHDFELEPHGLFVLHPTPEIHVEPAALEVDIVAVHGLNGTARKTWTDPASRTLWLEDEDLLPASFPKARIMTYGYDSVLAFTSPAGLESFARDLLKRLRILRASAEARTRPLVFVAHCLGGLLVKKVYPHHCATLLRHQILTNHTR